MVSALYFFVIALLVLTELGIRQHDNYEYYGKYQVLFLMPPTVGLFLPWFLAWDLRNLKRDKHS